MIYRDLVSQRKNIYTYFAICKDVSFLLLAFFWGCGLWGMTKERGRTYGCRIPLHDVAYEV